MPQDPANQFKQDDYKDTEPEKV